jgi:hypothetical protein
MEIAQSFNRSHEWLIAFGVEALCKLIMDDDNREWHMSSGIVRMASSWAFQTAIIQNRLRSQLLLKHHIASSPIVSLPIFAEWNYHSASHHCPPALTSLKLINDGLAFLKIHAIISSKDDVTLKIAQLPKDLITPERNWQSIPAHSFPVSTH